MLIFRSMKEDSDGAPQVGPSGRTLGVRPGGTPNPDVLAANDRDVVNPGDGGMSVAPNDPKGLPRHRRPASLGGLGQDPVWCIDTDDLEPELQFRQDSRTHGLIEPKQAMSLQEFQEALARTRNRWRLH